MGFTITCAEGTPRLGEGTSSLFPMVLVNVFSQSLTNPRTSLSITCILAMLLAADTVASSSDEGLNHFMAVTICWNSISGKCALFDI